jgi:hypothetical protein
MGAASFVMEVHDKPEKQDESEKLNKSTAGGEDTYNEI